MINDNNQHNLTLSIYNMFLPLKTSFSLVSKTITLIFVNHSDIDECQEYGKCSQICTNLKGTFQCSCKPGYHLDADKTTCRALGKVML